MAITATNRYSNAGGDPSPVTSSSFTVPAGDYIYVFVGASAASNPGVPSVSDSLGLTWTHLNGYWGVGFNHGIGCWRAKSTGSSMTVTVTAGSPAWTEMAFSVISVSSAALDATNYAGNGNPGAPTPNLSTAPLETSITLGFLYTSTGGTTPTTPTGFTRLNSGLVLRAYETVYSNPPQQNLSWSISGDGIAMHIEVKRRGAVFSGSPGFIG